MHYSNIYLFLRKQETKKITCRIEVITLICKYTVVNKIVKADFYFYISVLTHEMRFQKQRLCFLQTNNVNIAVFSVLINTVVLFTIKPFFKWIINCFCNFCHGRFQ